RGIRLILNCETGIIYFIQLILSNETALNHSLEILEQTHGPSLTSFLIFSNDLPHWKYMDITSCRNLVLYWEWKIAPDLK
ncbi:MAG: hypothetical protein ACXWV6_15880, partial [Chitinophagaceae bacterium]